MSERFGDALKVGHGACHNVSTNSFTSLHCSLVTSQTLINFHSDRVFGRKFGTLVRVGQVQDAIQTYSDTNVTWHILHIYSKPSQSDSSMIFLFCFAHYISNKWNNLVWCFYGFHSQKTVEKTHGFSKFKSAAPAVSSLDRAPRRHGFHGASV